MIDIRRSTARGRRSVAGRAALLLFAAARIALAQQSAPAPVPVIKPWRYDEDYSFLRDAQRRTGSPLDGLKYVPLDDDGDAWLTFGGEVRLRYEAYANDGWGGAKVPDHDYLWQRALPYVDLHLDRHLRAFAELISAYEFGDKAGKRRIDEDRADVLQAFGEIDGRVGDGSVTARVGRQVLALGSERLVSTRYGPNVLQSFDVARVLLRQPGWRVDAFYGRPADMRPASFDDHASRDETVWACYTTVDLGFAEHAGVDLYYIGHRSEHAVYDQGSGKELRHTLGSRFFGRADGFDWNCEAFWQLGRFAGGDIRAWSFASDTGHTFRTLPAAPRVGLKANVISGDRDRTDRNLQTFDPLFPRGKYFGQIGLLGPYNLANLHGSLELHFADGVKLELASVCYWRQSTGDGVYDNGGHLLRSGAGTHARFIGTQYDAELTWQISRSFEISAAVSLFEPGAFVRDTGAGGTVRYVGTECRFVF